MDLRPLDDAVCLQECVELCIGEESVEVITFAFPLRSGGGGRIAQFEE
jgi:hypothetical protein